MYCVKYKHLYAENVDCFCVIMENYQQCLVCVVNLKWIKVSLNAHCAHKGRVKMMNELLCTYLIKIRNHFIEPFLLSYKQKYHTIIDILETLNPIFEHVHKLWFHDKKKYKSSVHCVSWSKLNILPTDLYHNNYLPVLNAISIKSNI